MLCSLCNSINLDKLPSWGRGEKYRHHANLQELTASADRDCKLCVLIVEKLQRRGNWNPQDGPVCCGAWGLWNPGANHFELSVESNLHLNRSSFPPSIYAKKRYNPTA